jgi:hypothetical protein
MANGFAFTSYDGADEDGVRAEVHVQRGTGEVKDITPHENGKVAQIQIRTEGLKFAQKAWINTETPQYKVIQEAYENRTPIEYRIESQRKLKNDTTKQPIPRDTPIAELRSSTEIARENTKTLLVGVNGELTDEAVTHPKEDPSQAGRRPAPDPDVAKAAAANTQVAPAQHQVQQHRGGAAVEEPPYKEYNTDGSLNLGSYAVQAAVGAELFVRKALIASGVEASDDDIVRYASISLAIADKIQAYVTGKKSADRMATSHARVRSLVYDVIDNFLPIPASHAGDAEWVSKVGKLTLDRFNASMRIASEPFDLASLSSGSAPAAPKKEQAPATRQPAPEAHVEAPVAEEPVSHLAAEESSSDIPEDVPASSGGLLDNAKSFEIYPPVKAEKVTAANKMTEETLNTFKEFVTESEADFAKLTKLLQYTFDVTKASMVSEDQFGDFLDFYVERGPENFLEVLEYVDTINPDN